MSFQGVRGSELGFVVKPLSRAVYSGFWLMSLGLVGVALCNQPALVQEESTAAVNEPVALPALSLQVDAARGLSMLRTPAALEQSYSTTAGGAGAFKPNTTGSQATLRDLIGHQPEVTLLDLFGGNDHPVILIRGSGIQSQPMSRGINLLVDGLP